MMQSNPPRHQGGMTFISWVFVLAIFGFFVLLGLKLFPIYSTNYSVRQAMESVGKEPGVGDKSNTQVMDMLESRLYMNYVRDLPKDAIKIKRDTDGRRVLEANYEVREKIMFNVDVMVAFNHKHGIGN